MLIGSSYIGVTVCFFCHDGMGNFLMQLRGIGCRDEQGCWDIGAGALEFGDTIENTLRREIREEYCADVLSFQFIGVREVHRTRNGKPTHWIALDYKVHVDPRGVQNGEPHKCERIGWFTLASLPTPTHSQLSLFLDKYKDVLET